MSWRHWLGLILAAGLGGCGGEGAARPPAPIAPSPPAPPAPMSDAPVDDPVQAYAQAEAALQAHVTALAMDAAAGVIAAHARRPEDEGAELVWYPTLRHVAARQRQVIYAAPEAGAVQRAADPAQPFLVEIIVPCQVWTKSGDGVTYAGEAPPQGEPLSDRALPQATLASDSTVLAEAIRPAAEAALASCAAAEPVRDMVRITLLFTFRRDQGAVELLRHARNDAGVP